MKSTIKRNKKWSRVTTAMAIIMSLDERRLCAKRSA
jgi:hypothetical protein